jgi:MOSC domain-containing protein YiiM/GNAT superfamily N-acetyltransferase
MEDAGRSGRVLQVNVSPGGVPKLPVPRAWVDELGLDGDAHHDRTEHGGPHRAVCLFGIEAIERLRSEGHPVEAGSTGENLTTSGVEWSLLPVGARARIGAELELEIAGDAGPCATQAHNFRDGKYSRMSIELHQSDSRMYARVLHEGEVKPGDSITILPPAPDSRAREEALLERLDAAEGKSSLAAWQAAAGAGFDVRIIADGELLMAASPDLPGPAFNHANGLARLPNLISEATAFFDAHGCPGWLVTDRPPWPGALHTLELEIHAAEPSAIAPAALPRGVIVRPLEPDEGTLVEAVYGRAGSGDDRSSDSPDPWPAVYAALTRHPHRTILVAVLQSQPVAVATLHTHRRTGWLRGAAVIPEARGRGIQRALVAERVKLAVERGCDLVGASAELGSMSARNLAVMGMRPVGRRRHYRYEPAGTPV